MITLSSEEGKLIRIDTWEDVVTRPRFSQDLDPRQHELASIIGRYMFKEEIRCGLSECHAWHQKGYIVLTKDNRETNIGKDCGKKYFGVDFETMSRQYERDIAAAENRERLWSFSFGIEDVDAKIEHLRKRERGADWIYKKLQRKEQMNQHADIVNKERDEHNARSLALNQRCAGMAVRAADHEAVLKEFSAGLKKPNKPREC